MVLPSFHFCIGRNHSLTTITVQLHINMASHRELSKLTTNMNTIPSNGRLSRNSQGIHNMSHHPMEYTALQLDQQHTPVDTPLPRNMLTTSNPNQTPLQQIHHLPRDRLNASHHVSDRMASLSTHQVNPFNKVPSSSVIKYHS